MTYPFRTEDKSTDWADETALRLIDLAKSLPRENAQRAIAIELRSVKERGVIISTRHISQIANVVDKLNRRGHKVAASELQNVLYLATHE